MTSTQAQNSLQRAYVKAGGTNTALPWADIIAAILKLLQNCPSKNVRDIAKAHPVVLQTIVARDIDPDDDLGLSARDRRLVAKAAVDRLASTSAGDLDELRGL